MDETAVPVQPEDGVGRVLDREAGQLEHLFRLLAAADVGVRAEQPERPPLRVAGDHPADRLYPPPFARLGLQPVLQLIFGARAGDALVQGASGDVAVVRVHALEPARRIQLQLAVCVAQHAGILGADQRFAAAEVEVIEAEIPRDQGEAQSFLVAPQCRFGIATSPVFAHGLGETRAVVQEGCELGRHGLAVAALTVGDADHSDQFVATEEGQSHERVQRRMAGRTAMSPWIAVGIVGDHRPGAGHDGAEERVQVAELQSLWRMLRVERPCLVVPGDVADRLGAQEGRAVVVAVNLADEAVLALGHCQQ